MRRSVTHQEAVVGLEGRYATIGLDDLRTHRFQIVKDLPDSTPADHSTVLPPRPANPSRRVPGRRRLTTRPVNGFRQNAFGGPRFCQGPPKRQRRVRMRIGGNGRRWR
jgi:hypothetical protein